jgi:vacuolar-type H+-ATPase subunit I/STV1
MEDRYVIENNGRKIVFLRPHNNMSVQIRLEPGDIYTDIYDLDENDINYYRQLAKNGLHLMKYENYLRKEGRTDELKEYLADEEEVKDEEVKEVDETVEEEIQDEQEKQEESEEEIQDEQEKQEESEEEDKYADITENKLKEMEEEEVRDLAEELDVGNYWNKKIDNLAKDILAKLKE